MIFDPAFWSMLWLCLTPFVLGNIIGAHCCCAQSECDTCIEGTDSEEYQIDIAGIGNASCSECVDFNGTWFVSRGVLLGPFLGGGEGCTWQAIFDPTICGADVLEMGLNPTQFDVAMIRSSDSFPVFVFTQHLSFDPPIPKRDCSTFSPDTANGGSVCTDGSATCSITPV